MKRLLSAILLTISCLVAASAQEGPIPYTPLHSVSITVNGDPTSRMGFCWLTEVDWERGVLQIAEGDADDLETFLAGATEIEARSRQTNKLCYSNEKNGLEDVEPLQRKYYMTHKAVAEGLKPATRYSYRVGYGDMWSEIGHFSTAEHRDEYSFIYFTDTQALNAEMFDISQKTVHAAVSMLPEAQFILCNGDLVESGGRNNSEWEYMQWFSTMQDVWMSYPLVVTQGNHDVSGNKNFVWHFNNDNSFNETSPVKTFFDGTVFSFELGDVLYLVLNFEDTFTEGYLEALGNWMRERVSASEDRWRVASFHRNMFTGSSKHQDEAEARAMREKMLPVFAELDIDIAIQGHDHVYEVMGPVDNLTMTLAEGGVVEVDEVEPCGEANLNGREGGVYNVIGGTLYFLNNSAGKKKYTPRTREEMEAAIDAHGVEGYWDLFTGRYAQTYESTFSIVSVSPEAITFDTYTVDDEGEAHIFDSIKVIKQEPEPEPTQPEPMQACTQAAIGPQTLESTTPFTTVSETLGDAFSHVLQGHRLTLTGAERFDVTVSSLCGLTLLRSTSTEVDLSGLASGVYLVSASTGSSRHVFKLALR